jgi:hypothetical protein
MLGVDVSLLDVDYHTLAVVGCSIVVVTMTLTLYNQFT